MRPRLPIQPLKGSSELESEERDTLPVIDNVNLDLESHISHYQGLPRIYRLEFIADHCRSLRIEALNLAIEYIKEKTYNVKDYTRLMKKLTAAKEELEGPVAAAAVQVDTAWIDTKTKQAALRFEKLDNDLKSYRVNMMKENIRRGQDDLGDHYLDCGDLESASNAYSGSRDYASSLKYQINQCLNMIRVSILLRRWSTVSNHVLRAESQPNTDNPSSPAISTKLHCAAGLYELNSRKYKKAARNFLSTNFDHFTSGQQSSVQACSIGHRTPQLARRGGGHHASSSAGSSFGSGSFGNSSHERDFTSSTGHWDVIAPVNIAVYASLCALATYSRQELATHLINSTSFKQFSELDPQLREAVSRFYESRYASCLSILQEIKNTLLLDMYLAPHVERLYRAIRNKALVQYFEPFSAASMHKMAEAFNTTVGDLEKEIITLIYDGHLKARIDSHNKILYAKDMDSRTNTFEHAIRMGKLWQRQTRALISRTAILNANLIVTNSTQTDRAS